MKNIRKYLRLDLMVEKKDGFSYTPYNSSVNADIFSWKAYENFSQAVINDHDLFEFKLNLSDAVVMGTPDHKSKMKVVTPRFQVRLDVKQFFYDTYIKC